MGLFDWLKSRNGDAEGSEGERKEDRPPKPDPMTKTLSKSFDLYSITVSYRDGESETFEAVEYEFGDRVFELNEPRFECKGHYYGHHFQGMAPVPSGSSAVHVPYETLARRVEIETVGQVVAVCEYEVDYVWGLTTSPISMTWKEVPTDSKITEVGFQYDDENDAAPQA